MTLAIVLLVFSAFSVVAVIKLRETRNNLDHLLGQLDQTDSVAQTPTGVPADVQFTESLLALGKVRLQAHDDFPTPEPAAVSSSVSARPGRSRTRVQEL
jgi:hypothetical protein